MKEPRDPFFDPASMEANKVRESLPDSSNVANGSQGGQLSIGSTARKRHIGRNGAQTQIASRSTRLAPGQKESKPELSMSESTKIPGMSDWEAEFLYGDRNKAVAIAKPFDPKQAKRRRLSRNPALQRTQRIVEGNEELSLPSTEQSKVNQKTSAGIDRQKTTSPSKKAPEAGSLSEPPLTSQDDSTTSLEHEESTRPVFRQVNRRRVEPLIKPVEHPYSPANGPLQERQSIRDRIIDRSRKTLALFSRSRGNSKRPGGEVNLGDSAIWPNDPSPETDPFTTTKNSDNRVRALMRVVNRAIRFGGITKNRPPELTDSSPQTEQVDGFTQEFKGTSSNRLIPSRSSEGVPASASTLEQRPTKQSPTQQQPFIGRASKKMPPAPISNLRRKQTSSAPDQTGNARTTSNDRSSHPESSFSHPNKSTQSTRIDRNATSDESALDDTRASTTLGSDTRALGSADRSTAASRPRPEIGIDRSANDKTKQSYDDKKDVAQPRKQHRLSRKPIATSPFTDSTDKSDKQEIATNKRDELTKADKPLEGSPASADKPLKGSPTSQGTPTDGDHISDHISATTTTQSSEIQRDTSSPIPPTTTDSKIDTSSSGSSPQDPPIQPSSRPFNESTKPDFREISDQSEVSRPKISMRSKTSLSRSTNLSSSSDNSISSDDLLSNSNDPLLKSSADSPFSSKNAPTVEPKPEFEKTQLQAKSQTIGRSNVTQKVTSPELKPTATPPAEAEGTPASEAKAKAEAEATPAPAPAPAPVRNQSSDSGSVASRPSSDSGTPVIKQIQRSSEVPSKEPKRNIQRSSDSSLDQLSQPSATSIPTRKIDRALSANPNKENGINPISRRHKIGDFFSRLPKVKVSRQRASSKDVKTEDRHTIRQPEPLQKGQEPSQVSKAKLQLQSPNKQTSNNEPAINRSTHKHDGSERAVNRNELANTQPGHPSSAPKFAPEPGKQEPTLQRDISLQRSRSNSPIPFTGTNAPEPGKQEPALQRDNSLQKSRSNFPIPFLGTSAPEPDKQEPTLQRDSSLQRPRLHFPIPFIGTKLERLISRKPSPSIVPNQTAHRQPTVDTQPHIQSDNKRSVLTKLKLLPQIISPFNSNTESPTDHLSRSQPRVDNQHTPTSIARSPRNIGDGDKTKISRKTPSRSIEQATPRLRLHTAATRTNLTSRSTSTSQNSQLSSTSDSTAFRSSRTYGILDSSHRSSPPQGKHSGSPTFSGSTAENLSEALGVEIQRDRAGQISIDLSSDKHKQPKFTGNLDVPTNFGQADLNSPSIAQASGPNNGRLGGTHNVHSEPQRAIQRSPSSQTGGTPGSYPPGRQISRSPNSGSNSKPSSADIDAIYDEIYGRLKDDLRFERERRGGFYDDLP